MIAGIRGLIPPRMIVPIAGPLNQIRARRPTSVQNISVVYGIQDPSSAVYIGHLQCTSTSRAVKCTNGPLGDVDAFEDVDSFHVYQFKKSCPFGQRY